MIQRSASTSKRQDSSSDRSYNITPVQRLIEEESFSRRCISCFCSKYSVGIIAIVFLVVLWVGSGFLTKDILADYDKPFMMTFLSCISFQVYFIFCFTGDPLLPEHVSPKTAEHEEMKETLKPLSIKEHAWLGFLFFILYFLANYTTNYAYSAVSVGSASILLTTTSLFSLIFGLLAKVETATFVKFFAAILSCGGVMFLFISEIKALNSQTWGTLSALASSALYALYTVFLKKVTHDESRLSQNILFAFVGFYTFGLLWPGFVLFHYLGWEKFELPPREGQIGAIAFNIILGSLFANFMWNVAFAFTSLLVVSIGTSISLPLTLILDTMVTGTPITWYKISSAVFVMVGFILINVATVYPELDKTCDSIIKCFRPVSPAQKKLEP